MNGKASAKGRVAARPHLAPATGHAQPYGLPLKGEDIPTPVQPIHFRIVTPSFNTRRFLGACVDSVLSQDYPHLDYRVMDGGSTDGSVDLLRSYDGRVRWTSARDGGQSDAINRGFALRDGEAVDPDGVLGWLNSDDAYAPGALAHVADIFARHPDADVVYGRATYIDAAGRHVADCAHVEPYSKHRLLHYSDLIVQPAAFFRRRAFDAVGGLDAGLNWMMDWDLWIKFARRDLRFVHTPRVLAHYRWLSGNKSAVGGAARLDEIDRAMAAHGLPRPAYVQLERCNLHLGDAVKALGRGRVDQAAVGVGRIAATLARSPRAVRSLFSLHTWRIIWVGQVLRARAAAADRPPPPASSPPGGGLG
ncbi:MAG: hypothetical protein JWO31_4080 [Phycisphaerales bacterium]|nr:hypothetical protein [Phycisphaerales bacterium]